jgi:hypothetical protein
MRGVTDMRKGQGACDAAPFNKAQPSTVPRRLRFPVQAHVAVVVIGKTPAIDFATFPTTASGECFERKTDDGGSPV